MCGREDVSSWKGDLNAQPNPWYWERKKNLKLEVSHAHCGSEKSASSEYLESRKIQFFACCKKNWPTHPMIINWPILPLLKYNRPIKNATLVAPPPSLCSADIIDRMKIVITPKLVTRSFFPFFPSSRRPRFLRPCSFSSSSSFRFGVDWTGSNMDLLLPSAF